MIASNCPRSQVRAAEDRGDALRSVKYVALGVKRAVRMHPNVHSQPSEVEQFRECLGELKPR